MKFDILILQLHLYIVLKFTCMKVSYLFIIHQLYMVYIYIITYLELGITLGIFNLPCITWFASHGTQKQEGWPIPRVKGSTCSIMWHIQIYSVGYQTVNIQRPTYEAYFVKPDHCFLGHVAMMTPCPKLKKNKHSGIRLTLLSLSIPL